MNACYVCIPTNQKETKRVIETGRRRETESEDMTKGCVNTHIDTQAKEEAVG